VAGTRLDEALAPEHEVDGALAAAVDVHGVQEHVDHDVIQVRGAAGDPLQDDQEAQVAEQGVEEDDLRDELVPAGRQQTAPVITQVCSACDLQQVKVRCCGEACRNCNP